MLSGSKKMYVPFSSSVGSVLSEVIIPFSKVALLTMPSRYERTSKRELSAFTAFTPTPLSPTLFLKAFESYLPPVLRTLTASIIFPCGMPRP